MLKKYTLKKIQFLKTFLSLSFFLAAANFKIRNEGSYLGLFWYLLNPFLFFILLIGIFGKNLGSGIEQYPLYLLMGIIVFNFFQQTTSSSTRAVSGTYSNIIKSVNFPRESIIGAEVLGSLFSHFFEIVLFTVFIIWFKVSLAGLFFYIPVLILFSICTYGISLIISSFTVYFIDLDNIWGFFTKLLFFATPIFYPLASGTPLSFINTFNPVYYFLDVSRDLVIYNKFPAASSVTGCIVSTFIFLLVGIIIFGILKKRFAEKI